MQINNSNRRPELERGVRTEQCHSKYMLDLPGRHRGCDHDEGMTT